MKPRLSKFLCAALLAAQCSTVAYAVGEPLATNTNYTLQADGTYKVTASSGIEYTLTANSDGTYNAKAVISTGDVTPNASPNAGSTYVTPVGGESVVDKTPIHDATITMDGGNIMGDLSAGSWAASPISGTVQIDITGGYIGTLYGGNRLSTAFTTSYGYEASIEKITINVGGNSKITTIRGTSVVSPDGGEPDEAFAEKFTTIKGDVSINVSGNADVAYIYGTLNDYDIVKGCVDVTLDGVKLGVDVNENIIGLVKASYGGKIEKDTSVTLKNGAAAGAVYAVYTGEVGGNASVILNNGSSADYAFAVSTGKVGGDATVEITDSSATTVSAAYDGQIEGNATVNIKGSKINSIYAVASGTAGKNAEVITENAEVGTIYAVTAGTVNEDAVVTINEGSDISIIVGIGSGTVKGNTYISATDSKVGAIYGINGGTIENDLFITTKGGNTTAIRGLYGGTVKKDVIITTQAGTVDEIYGVNYGTVMGDVSVSTQNTSTTYLRGNWDGNVTGDVLVSTNEGNVEYLIGSLGGAVEGDIVVTTNGSKVGDGIASLGAEVSGDVYYNINGGEHGNVLGACRGYVKGDVTITMTDGSTQDITGVSWDEYGTASVEGDLSVYLLGGRVNGKITGVVEPARANASTLYIGSNDKAYNGTVKEITDFDHVVIAPGSAITTTSGNIFNVKEQSYNVTEKNLTSAIVSTSGNVVVEDSITLNLNVPSTLKSGRYMLIDASEGTVDTTNWTEENVEVNSGNRMAARAREAASSLKVSLDDLGWTGNILYLYLVNEDAQNVISGNWGAFKSSQAFVNTLWGKRPNSVELKPTVETDEKGVMITTATPTGRTLAWGSVYGQSARIGSIGADYSLYGGAIGVEHQCANRSSIGVAFGYDWGKVSPFSQARIDQETAHIALYGRAAEWAVCRKGSIAIDWSAAVGKTSSETDATAEEWSQKHLQLDARVSYLHELNEKATASVFAGMQYFAVEDASVGLMGISSMQNLRTEIGAGLTYKLTPKTTLWGEASIYNDAMRHNPRILLGDRAYSGTNPGRFGGSISVGGSYQINENWSLNGNYLFDAADDSVEHNVNMGASYQF